ncbi:MAG: type 1 glutamine amidotransferase [Methanoregula sp.]|jgi:GMP synthase-like glutamine amidotransferase
MITILQHGEHEPAGSIVPSLESRNEQYEIIRLYEDARLPSDPPEKLVILGGQMSVNDEKEYPFLVPEKALIKKAVAQGSTVLGVCLGAQMIAAACGKTVYREETELGWKTIAGCNTPGHRFFPDEFLVFHWHKETFDLPDGALLLATGNKIKNQAFLLKNALGVQFHPEVTEEIIAYWARDLNEDDRAVITSESEKNLTGNRFLCDAVIHAFLAGWKF